MAGTSLTLTNEDGRPAYSGRRGNYYLAMMPDPSTNAMPTLALPNPSAKPNGPAMIGGAAAKANAYKDPEAFKNSILAELRAELTSANGGPEKATAVLGKLDLVKDLPNAKSLTMDILKTGLESTTASSERAQMMSELIKRGPSPETMKENLVQISKSSPALTSLKGADLTDMRPEDVAILPLKHMEITGSKWPANVVLTGDQDGLNIEGVSAPGLDVRNTTGTIRAAGADVSGGAINSSSNMDMKLDNAKKLGAAGAKTNFRLADPSGNGISLSQAMSAGGEDGVKRAMQNGLANGPEVKTSSTRDYGTPLMGVISAPAGPLGHL